MNVKKSRFIKNFKYYQDELIKNPNEPVFITSRNEIVGVFLSYSEYESLRRDAMKSQECQECQECTDVPQYLIDAVADILDTLEDMDESPNGLALSE